MSEKYKIKEILGMYFVQDTDGIYINAAELSQLIDRLQSLRDSMIAQQIDQIAIQDQQSEHLIEEIVCHATIHYPVQPREYPFLEYRPGSGAMRQHKHKRYSGVYFITSPARKGIKVGQSYDIYKRTYQLFLNHDREIFFVMGFIETDDFVLLEKLLHRKFSAFNIGNEWFERDPLLAWLKGIGGKP